MGYTVRQVMRTAERYGIPVRLEPHQAYTVRQDAFLRKRHKYDGVLSVECGTVDRADRSLKYLGGLLAGG
jgi:sugar phosphate isomerase/epimerase